MRCFTALRSSRSSTRTKTAVGLYGRRITDGETAHLYLPGPRRGVFNFQAAKRSKSIILTEKIIDALTLYNAGFKDVIPCYGVNGFTRDLLDLITKSQVKEVYICFDRDDAGKEGAEKAAAQLKEKGIDAYIVSSRRSRCRPTWTRWTSIPFFS